MFKTKTPSFTWLTTALAFLAAVIYCSWPLGYVLNPRVSDSGGLASELGAIGQPYNWVFIVGDVIAGVLIMIITGMLLKKMLKRQTWLVAVLVCYALFGLFTLIDALLPMSCDPSIAKVCPSIAHDPLLIVHGMASILASVFLFLSALFVWWQFRATPAAWFTSTIMVGYVVFGVASFIFFFVPGPGSLSQHYYITLCSLWAVALPVILLNMRKSTPRATRWAFSRATK